jgi:hypothetical protein
VYNDRAVLENHHTSYLFDLIDHHCLMDSLPEDDYRIVRKKIVDAVLATDMSRHFELCGDMAKLLRDFELEDAMKTRRRVQLPEDSRQTLVRVLLHNADISNPAKPWDLSKRWSDLICEEFYRQGDLERAKCLTISPNMDRSKNSQATMSCNFIDFVIEPSYALLKLALPLASECYEHLRQNRLRWGEARDVEVRAAAAVAQAAVELAAASPTTQRHQAHAAHASHSHAAETTATTEPTPRKKLVVQGASLASARVTLMSPAVYRKGSLLDRTASDEDSQPSSTVATPGSVVGEHPEGGLVSRIISPALSKRIKRIISGNSLSTSATEESGGNTSGARVHTSIEADASRESNEYPSSAEQAAENTARRKSSLLSLRAAASRRSAASAPVSEDNTPNSSSMDLTLRRSSGDNIDAISTFSDSRRGSGSRRISLAAGAIDVPETFVQVERDWYRAEPSMDDAMMPSADDGNGAQVRAQSQPARSRLRDTLRFISDSLRRATRSRTDSNRSSHDGPVRYGRVGSTGTLTSPVSPTEFSSEIRSENTPASTSPMSIPMRLQHVLAHPMYALALTVVSLIALCGWDIVRLSFSSSADAGWTGVLIATMVLLWIDVGLRCWSEPRYWGSFELAVDVFGTLVLVAELPALYSSEFQSLHLYIARARLCFVASHWPRRFAHVAKQGVQSVSAYVLSSARKYRHRRSGGTLSWFQRLRRGRSSESVFTGSGGVDALRDVEMLMGMQILPGPGPSSSGATGSRSSGDSTRKSHTSEHQRGRNSSRGTSHAPNSDSLSATASFHGTSSADDASDTNVRFSAVEALYGELSSKSTMRLRSSAQSLLLDSSGQLDPTRSASAIYTVESFRDDLLSMAGGLKRSSQPEIVLDKHAHAEESAVVQQARQMLQRSLIVLVVGFALLFGLFLYPPYESELEPAGRDLLALLAKLAAAANDTNPASVQALLYDAVSVQNSALVALSVGTVTVVAPSRGQGLRPWERTTLVAPHAAATIDVQQWMQTSAGLSLGLTLSLVALLVLLTALGERFVLPKTVGFYNGLKHLIAQAASPLHDAGRDALMKSLLEYSLPRLATSSRLNTLARECEREQEQLINDVATLATIMHVATGSPWALGRIQRSLAADGSFHSARSGRRLRGVFGASTLRNTDWLATILSESSLGLVNSHIQLVQRVVINHDGIPIPRGAIVEFSWLENPDDAAFTAGGSKDSLESSMNSSAGNDGVVPFNKRMRLLSSSRISINTLLDMRGGMRAPVGRPVPETSADKAVETCVFVAEELEIASENRPSSFFGRDDQSSLEILRSKGGRTYTLRPLQFLHAGWGVEGCLGSADGAGAGVYGPHSSLPRDVLNLLAPLQCDILLTDTVVDQLSPTFRVQVRRRNGCSLTVLMHVRKVSSCGSGSHAVLRCTDGRLHMGSTCLRGQTLVLQ